MASVSQFSKAPASIAVGGGGVLLEHGMCIDSGEAKRVDAGSPWRVSESAWIQGRAVGLRANGLVWFASRWVSVSGVQGRRQDAMKERQRRLDQSGHARGRHGVADHRGDSAQEPAAMRRARETRR